MKNELFDELVESVRESGAIRRGEKMDKIAELEADNAALKLDLLNVLKVAIARGENLGYVDEGWRNWLRILEGGDDAE